jgi:mRNA interferase RelE/StbE
MWKIKFIPAAEDDLQDIDQSVRVKILRGIKKLEKAPLEYGKPLGNQNGRELVGLRKIEPADGYRVIYWVMEKEVYVLIIAVGKRNKMTVYKTAAERIAEYRKMTEMELEKISALLDNMNIGS